MKLNVESAKEYAKRNNIKSVSYVYRLMREGKIKTTTIGGKKLIQN